MLVPDFIRQQLARWLRLLKLLHQSRHIHFRRRFALINKLLKPGQSCCTCSYITLVSQPWICPNYSNIVVGKSVKQLINRIERALKLTRQSRLTPAFSPELSTLCYFLWCQPFSRLVRRSKFTFAAHSTPSNSSAEINKSTSP